MILWTDKKRNKKGFTLVELILVIAIIGIIGAIAVPRFSDLITVSRIKADAATAAEIITAVRIKEAETGEMIEYTVEEIDGEEYRYKKASEYLENYMDVPKPKSVDPESKGEFFLAGGEKRDGDGNLLYEVYWRPSKDTGIYDIKQVVTEGQPFEIKTNEEGK